MARYKVILAYDGTDFHGFQRQADARTVQGEVEKALGKIGWQGSTLLAAGRTDAGVHASGQVIAFDFDWAHASEDLLAALNATLPKDAAAQAISSAYAEFHPRFEAVSRRYRYRIFCQPQADPLRARYAWRVWPEVLPERLQAAAEQFLGEHDFAAFGRPPKPGGATIRQVFAAQWHSAGDELSFGVEANGFLYHMVRRMVSLQVEIAQQRAEPDAVSRYLREGSEPVQGLAPAQGLTLVEVRYA